MAGHLLYRRVALTLPAAAASRFLRRASALQSRYRFLHWPLAFPEIFTDERGEPLGGVEPEVRDRAVAAGELRALAERVGSTAHLTVADGEEALALAVVEPSWTDFHVSYRVGSRHPLSQGAAGKAILLGRSGDTTPWTVTTGELQTGARGLAAPVRGVEGLDASVGIVTLGAEIDVDTVGPQVSAAAAEVASRLS